MPAPTISAMPAAPSRIGDPLNFFGESLAFLDAQPALKTDLDAVRSHFDGALYNTDNWGLITDAVQGGSPVTITNLPEAAPTGSGFAYISAVDSVLASIGPFITDANAVASYVDGFIDAGGTADPSAPSILVMPSSQTRNDQLTSFNSKAVAFYNGLVSWANSLNALADYVTETLGGTEDWGLVSQGITETEDYGLIV